MSGQRCCATNPTPVHYWCGGGEPHERLLGIAPVISDEVEDDDGDRFGSFGVALENVLVSPITAFKDINLVPAGHLVHSRLRAVGPAFPPAVNRYPRLYSRY